MKKQMIKLSVIAAVLSGMTFSAMAADPVTSELDLSATVSRGGCDVKAAGGGVTTMDWPTLLASDFAAAGAKIGLGQVKTVVLNFENCAGEDLANDDVINLVASQPGVTTALSNADMWGNSDTTGVGFQISGKQDGASVGITPKSPSMPLYTSTADGTKPGDLIPTDVKPVTLSVDVASVGNTAKAGTVKAVVTMAALYQ